MSMLHFTCGFSFSSSLSKSSSSLLFLPLHKPCFHFPHQSKPICIRLPPPHVSSSHSLPSKKQFLDSDDDEEEDEDYDDDDDDDEVAAEEYVDEKRGGEGEVTASMSSSVQGCRFEEHKWQRVERIRSEVREFGDGIIDFEELASIYDFPIDYFQHLAIQAFLRGSSVVVSAPTSSGKTLIAEAAAVATIARGKRLFYTTPLKALSNQKFRDFRDTFGESNVGLLTGDAAVNKDAQILIMTTEILRNMLYQRLFGIDISS